MKQQNPTSEKSNSFIFLIYKSFTFMITGFTFSLVMFQVRCISKLVVYENRQLDILHM